MKNLNALLILCLLVLAGGCAMEAEEETLAEEKVDLVALKAEFQAKEDAYGKAQNAKDAQGVAVYYAEDAHNLPEDAPTVKGKAAIMKRIKEEMASDTTDSEVKFEAVEVFADGNLAVEIGKSTSTMADGTVYTGKYLSVFEKRDGEWVCIRDIWNSDAPDDK